MFYFKVYLKHVRSKLNPAKIMQISKYHLEPSSFKHVAHIFLETVLKSEQKAFFLRPYKVWDAPNFSAILRSASRIFSRNNRKIGDPLKHQSTNKMICPAPPSRGRERT